MQLNRLKKMTTGGFLALTIAAIAIPALAQRANFGKLTLAPGFPASAGQVSGHTGGRNSLPAVVAQRDRRNNPCLGFGSPTPDHIMELQRDFSQLSVAVNSNGQDTTLIVQGPDNGTVRCGDDSGSSRDAIVEDNNWKAGTYRIWVGSMESGAKWNYTLSVRE